MKTVLPIELWGGVECSVNRVGDVFNDQLELAGYYGNSSKTDAILSLNLKTLRIPILWEKHHPVADTEPDWRWAEEQLASLKAGNTEPLVGLLHHGSGPAFTNLLDKNFPRLFAAYAAKVAKKFPWITLYNPINEPLTTARFSGLYGLWYPHKKNDVSFIRILLNELKAISLAMTEIRKINPAAKLVQTEDLGKTFSTPLLSYQANFENQRRWLTYDILSGKFDAMHPLWGYFMRLGIEEDEIQFFIDNPCTPDILGLNHYVTSERYLDENIDYYPPHTVGGNALHQYADVEAVRVPIKEPTGLSVLLREVWERYQIPIAITEVHLHCSREEQLRWLKEVYDTARALKYAGIDIIAVTVWALLGSYGWDKLLTSFPGTYETGVFDTSGNKIRPTALKELINCLTNNTSDLDHIAALSGWWKSNERYFYPGISAPSHESLQTRPIVIIGKSGTLGKAFSTICLQRNLPNVLLGRDEADITNLMKLKNMIARYRPWAIINAAGFTDVDKAEEQRNLCYRENYLGPRTLAMACEGLNIQLLCFSCDQVFDGSQKRPYKESDTAGALNIYGHSKQLMENLLTADSPSTLIVRTGPLFGYEEDFISKVISTLSGGKSFVADSDITVSPTYIPHLVHASLDLLIDKEKGIWHLSNKGAVTWYEWAKVMAINAGLDEQLIVEGAGANTAVSRPFNSGLQS
ncbi:MAG: family 1 glycosylhydrolase, partial [Ferruginibacter sp.]